MSKTKVVPIQHEPFGHQEPAIVRKDETTIGGVRQRRLILNVGRQRVAFDIATRVTELKPTTGNQLAPVVPLSARAVPKRQGPTKPATPRTSRSVSAS